RGHPCLDRRHRQNKAPQRVTFTIIANHNHSASLSRNEYQMGRSEEHTSELQSHLNLVCRLLLEKKKHIPRLEIDPSLITTPCATTPHGTHALSRVAAPASQEC